MTVTNIDIGPTLSGAFSADLQDPNGAPPANVIRVSDPFQIACSWYLAGGLAPSLGGTWHVEAAFEAIGPGPELRTGAINVVLNGLAGAPPAPGYATNIVVPAGANWPNGVPKLSPGDSSTPYEVTVLLTYTDVAGNPGPIAATVPLGTMTIFA